MIRKATLNDCYPLMVFIKQALIEADLPGKISEKEIINRITEALADDDSFIYIYGDFEGGVYLTFNDWFTEEKVANIEKLFVVPSKRGTKIAREMVAFARDFALQRGACIINADTVFTKHSKAYLNLFEKNGFKFSGYNLTYGKKDKKSS